MSMKHYPKYIYATAHHWRVSVLFLLIVSIAYSTPGLASDSSGGRGTGEGNRKAGDFPVRKDSFWMAGFFRHCQKSESILSGECVISSQKTPPGTPNVIEKRGRILVNKVYRKTREDRDIITFSSKSYTRKPPSNSKEWQSLLSDHRNKVVDLSSPWNFAWDLIANKTDVILIGSWADQKQTFALLPGAGVPLNSPDFGWTGFIPISPKYGTTSLRGLLEKIVDLQEDKGSTEKLRKIHGESTDAVVRRIIEDEVVLRSFESKVFTHSDARMAVLAVLSPTEPVSRRQWLLREIATRASGTEISEESVETLVKAASQLWSNPSEHAYLRSESLRIAKAFIKNIKRNPQLREMVMSSLLSMDNTKDSLYPIERWDGTRVTLVTNLVTMEKDRKELLALIRQ